MDLRARLLALLGPVALGDEIGPGTRIVDVSTEVGPRLTFSVSGIEVHVELVPARPNEDRAHAARTRRLLLSYRAGSADQAIEPSDGQALCRVVAGVIEPHEDEVLGALGREANAVRQLAHGNARIRELTVERVLEPAWDGERRYYTLSPYVGCLIGCRFCYAQSRVGVAREMQGLPQVPWGSYVDVRVNAAQTLARELESVAVTPIKFCPIVSDPYHAVERKYRITRACLEVLRDARPSRPVLVLTRSKLVERDLRVLTALPAAFVGMSTPTIDDEVRRHFEPRAAAIGERLELLARMRAAGISTFAVVQPVLPGSIDGLADALAESVGSVSIDVLGSVEGAREDFDDPRYREARQPQWQETRAHELADALRKRGVEVWRGELPPKLA